MREVRREQIDVFRSRSYKTFHNQKTRLTAQFLIETHIYSPFYIEDSLERQSKHDGCLVLFILVFQGSEVAITSGSWCFVYWQ